MTFSPKWVSHSVMRYLPSDVMSYDRMTMSTQLQVAHQDEGWAILNSGKPLAIKGSIYRESKDELVKEISSMGLFVWADNSIQKTEEAVSENEAYTPDPAPATEDPPTDPGSRPGNDPNPTVPTQVPDHAEDSAPVKPKRVRKPRAVKPKDEEPPMVFADVVSLEVVAENAKLTAAVVDDYSDLLDEAVYDASLVKPVLSDGETVIAKADIETSTNTTNGVDGDWTVDEDSTATITPAAEPTPEVLDKIDEGLKQIAEKKVVRRVRTKKGAELTDQPVGTEIPAETPPEIAEFTEKVEAEVKATPKRSKKVDAKITADYDKLSKTVAEVKANLPSKVARKPRAKKPEDAPRFTEEQKKARAEYARKYRQKMSDEQKEQAKARAAERQKRWREAHPEAVTKYAKRSSERRKERYNEDPAYRADYRSKQRAYASAGKTPDSKD